MVENLQQFSTHTSRGGGLPTVQHANKPGCRQTPNRSTNTHARRGGPQTAQYTTRLITINTSTHVAIANHQKFNTSRRGGPQTLQYTPQLKTTNATSTYAVVENHEHLNTRRGSGPPTVQHANKPQCGTTSTSPHARRRTTNSSTRTQAAVRNHQHLTTRAPPDHQQTHGYQLQRRPLLLQRAPQLSSARRLLLHVVKPGAELTPTVVIALPLRQQVLQTTLNLHVHAYVESRSQRTKQELLLLLRQ